MTLNVFECINWTRREHLVVLSALDLEDFWRSMREAPPSAAALWDLRADKVALECVARSMPENDAARFMDSYMAALRIPGWTVLSARGS
jgi:hypothetical protein